MSLSFPDRGVKSVGASAFVRAGMLMLAGACSGALAAETYFVPDVSVSAEHHSNFGLQTGASPFAGDIEGYFAAVGGVAGIKTPRSTTELRPVLRFQEYPDREDLQRVNGQLDLMSRYNSQRGSAQLFGQYRREDRYDAEIVGATFDDFNPDAPATDGNGRLVLASETRTSVLVRPQGSYRLSQRMRIGAEANFQTSTTEVRRGGTSSDFDYDYSLAKGFLAWNLGQRSELSTGVYAAEYKADGGSNTTDSLGASVELDHSWTETYSGTAELNVEETDVKRPGQVTDSSTNWGFNVGVVRRGEVNRLRLQAGRSFNPSTSGVRSTVDEVRLQYDRNLLLWRFSGALRGFRTRGQGDNSDFDDRKYARAELEVRRNLSRTWYVGGGYKYTWQEYVSDTDSASDSMFFVRVGYKGLPPQR